MPRGGLMRTKCSRRRAPASPSLDVLERACVALGLNEDTRRVCGQALAEYADRYRHGGYCEAGVAAAALYLCSRLLFERELGQVEVARACGVAPVTLRSYLRRLRAKVNVNAIMARYWAEVRERVFGPGPRAQTAAQEGWAAG